MTENKRAELARKLTERLIDEGRIIEAGWVSLCAMTMPAKAPQVQLDEMRNAFFAGAQHLFASIMVMLEPDAEPTGNDLRRLDLIDRELKLFLADFKRRKGLPED